MGTRSLTVFNDNEGTEIAVLYRQMDGYPTGHGADLKAFLKSIELVNGIPLGSKKRLANGMNCLAAQVIGHLKMGLGGAGVGGFYLYPAGTRNCCEEYIYVLSPGAKGKVNIRVYDVYGKKVLYNGPVSQFNPKAAERKARS